MRVHDGLVRLGWVATDPAYLLTDTGAGELARTFLERDWVRRAQGRGLRLTPAGQEPVRQRLDPLQPAPARAGAR